MILWDKSHRIRLWGATVTDTYLCAELGCFGSALGKKQILRSGTGEVYPVLLPKNLCYSISDIKVSSIKLERLHE